MPRTWPNFPLLITVEAVIGSGVNAGLTTYVGREARKRLQLDAVTEYGSLLTQEVSPEAVLDDYPEIG